MRATLFFLFYKLVVDSFNCGVEIVLLDTDDDVKLGRALIYHLDVYACIGNGGEYASGSSSRLDHSASYDGDKREIILDVKAVGLDVAVDSGKAIPL